MLRAIDTATTDLVLVAPAAAPAQSLPARIENGINLDLSLEQKYQAALNLVVPLKSPAQIFAMLAAIEAAKPVLYQQLGDLNYIHFARFLPYTDGSHLQVITAYDGDLESYIMDFVAVIGEIFTELLGFVADAPPLPVNDYPVEFVQYVISHNVSQVGVWSAYPHLTVIEINTATGS
jgi:hypothetical protein